MNLIVSRNGLSSQDIASACPDSRIVFAPPAVWQWLDGSRLPCCVQQLQGVLDDDPLLVRVARLSQGLAEGEPNIRDPRRFESVGHLFVHHYGHSWDTLGFQRPCHQSNGPVADWSGRSQEHGVHSSRLEPACGLRRRLLDQGRRVRNQAHE